MEALEFIAILILIAAIVVLVYYYLNNNAGTVNRIRNQIPYIVPNDNEAEKMPNGGAEMSENSNDNPSVGEKIKVKFKDIDMPSFNTDNFSKKIDVFLDSKSEELIRDWSLATKDDIDVLEKRWEIANMNLEALEKRFNEYRDFTNERIEGINERLKKLEKED